MEKRRNVRVSETRNYTVILEPAVEGGFVVRVPAFPEVCTEGDNESGALKMAMEAIELALEYRLSEGEEIPGEQLPQMRQVTVTVVAGA